MGYLSNLTRKLLDGEVLSQTDLIDSLEKVQKANQRIAHIVKGLRSFSHIQEETSKPFHTLDAVRGSFELVEEIYKKDGINIQLTYDSLDPALHMEGGSGEVTTNSNESHY